MLMIAISVLFGLIAFAALVQVHAAVSFGARRARLIAGELARQPKPRLQPHRQTAARFVPA